MDSMQPIICGALNGDLELQLNLISINHFFGIQNIMFDYVLWNIISGKEELKNLQRRTLC